MKKCSILYQFCRNVLATVPFYFPGHKLATVIGKIDRYPLFIYSEKFPIHQNETQALVYDKIDKNKRTADVKKLRGGNPNATEFTVDAGLGVNWQGKMKTVAFVLKIYKDCSVLEIYIIDDVNEPFSVEFFPA